jgi:phage host-nuclease inhibitor protein Gam
MTVFKKYKWTFIGLGIITIRLVYPSGLLIIVRKITTTHIIRRGNFEKYIETKGEIHGKDALLYYPR